ncbi:Alpha/Beta hydrolase protein [Roridomyces roridus]|uniref:Alpha/Beta hydrolase protein n=1 Tax=Roridomyces roridus TaxID=1738132 RepID=A0AAD7BHD2_9AGAR|nr:Alpha/Beta hydrolase protein [Roridomyces roridus]
MPPPRQHPWSIEFICRYIVTRILRLFVSIQFWLNPFPPFNNPNVVRTEDFVPSRDKGRDIRVRWYRPISAAKDKILPVLVHFHGSGFMLPLFGQDEGWCASVAEHAQMLVVDADYRKAPENPFPLALEDAEDVVQHVLASVAHTTLSLGGFSAGGSLAFGLTNTFGSRVHSIACFYPSLDAAADTAAQTDDPFLPPVMVSHIYACYMTPGTAWDNPRLSPAFVPTKDMPPHVWIAAGSKDPLHDAANAFVARLQREGHPDATFVSVAGQRHGFDRSAAGSVSLSPLGQEKHDEAIAFLKKNSGHR